MGNVRTCDCCKTDHELSERARIIRTITCYLPSDTKRVCLWMAMLHIMKQIVYNLFIKHINKFQLMS